METTTCMATPPEQVDSLIHVRHRIILSSAISLHSYYDLKSLIVQHLVYLFVFFIGLRRWWPTSMDCSLAA